MRFTRLRRKLRMKRRSVPRRDRRRGEGIGEVAEEVTYHAVSRSSRKGGGGGGFWSFLDDL